MKVQLLTHPKIPANEQEAREHRPVGRSTHYYQLMLEEMSAIAKACDNAGIEGFATTEHHFHTEGREMSPNPMLLYTKLASETEKLTFQPMSLVIPARDPIRTAEEIAMFDQMFPGRIQCGVARGYQRRWMQVLMQDAEGFSSFRPEEQKANERNRAIFNEHIDIMLLALKEDCFKFDGEHYKVPFPYEGIKDPPAAEVAAEFGAPGEVEVEGTLTKIGVVPGPRTDKVLELIAPFAGSPQTLIDCAKRNITINTLQCKRDLFTEQCETYRDLLVENGHEDAYVGQNMMAGRFICIADSREEAIAMHANSGGREIFEYMQRFGFAEPYRIPEEDDPDTFYIFEDRFAAAERMARVGVAICGTPEEVIEELRSLKRCHKDGNLDWLAWFFLQQGNETLDTQLDQIKRFELEIRPHI